MKVLTIVLSGLLGISLFGRSQYPNHPRANEATGDAQHAPTESEMFCGVEVCPNQVLMKLEGCGSTTVKKVVAKGLRRFLRAQTKDRSIEDRSLEVTPIGRRCLFLLRSSTWSVEQLMQFLTSTKTNSSAWTSQNLNEYGLNGFTFDYVEPNFKVKFDGELQSPPGTLPNDEHFVHGDQWGLENHSKQAMGIEAVKAWNDTTGSNNIVVGVVDSGIYYNHPDLKRNVWSAPKAFTVQVGGELIHCPKRSHGYNALGRTKSEKCNPDDDFGHGTMVSGIIGARGNNGIGVVGVNWKVKLLGLRIGNVTGTCISNAINAIDFAIQVKEKFPASGNIRVLNNSWGYLEAGDCDLPSRSLRDEIAEAGRHDMLVVGSAGENGGNDNDIKHHYPSGFDLPNVISVTAIQEDGEITSVLDNKCNHGKHSVHLGAPGYGIWSTYTLPREYYTGAMTSAAAPFVSGAAALILSAPDCSAINATELRRVIMLGAVTTPSLSETVTGGRLDVYRSIDACPKQTAKP